MNIFKSKIKKLLYSKGWHVVSRGAFGYDCMTDLKQLCPIEKVRTIFDIGANYGQTWITLREIFPDATIHCFEPSSEAASVLEKMTQHCPYTKVHRLALGNRNGNEALNLFTSQACNSLLKQSPQLENAVPEHLFKSKGNEIVKLQTLQSFMVQSSINRIDLLKVDTQGFDLEVLKGAGEALNHEIISYIRVELIFINQYENQCNPLEVISFLIERGYRLIGLYDAARDEINKSIKWCDALFG